MDSPVAATAAREAAISIRGRWSRPVTTGIILGTGLGKLSEEVDAEAIFSFEGLPGFPRATALGHRGRLILGHIGQSAAVVVDGRCHLYEGYSIDQITLPVLVMAELGVTSLIVSNASGGVNPQFRGGDIMVIEDHIDLTWTIGQPNPVRSMVPRGIGKSRCCYDRGAIRRAESAARSLGTLVHRGVYAALTGPNYETRAEYRMLRRLGADAVGMSTVPEAMLGAELGLQVLALSVITNVATPDVPKKTSAEQVIANASQAENRLRSIVLAVLEQ